MATPIQENTERLNVIKSMAAALPKQETMGVLQEKTVIPSAADQNISADGGYDGLSKVTVKGDSNLISENIKDGVTVFGVTGNLAGLEINALNLSSFLDYRSVISYYSKTEGQWVDVDREMSYFDEYIEDADLSRGLNISFYFDYYTKYEISMRISDNVLHIMQDGDLPSAGGI